MLVRDVLRKFDSIVPFPITSTKILQAGHDPSEYLLAMALELGKCDDRSAAKEVLRSCYELRLSLLN